VIVGADVLGFILLVSASCSSAEHTQLDSGNRELNVGKQAVSNRLFKQKMKSGLPFVQDPQPSSEARESAPVDYPADERNDRMLGHCS
jgi:hypothetical protein